MKLTGLQHQLLAAMDDEHPNDLRVGGDSHYSAQVARSLERRGIITLERDELGDLRARWDDESHADWLREVMANIDQVFV